MVALTLWQTHSSPKYLYPRAKKMPTLTCFFRTLGRQPKKHKLFIKVMMTSFACILYHHNYFCQYCMRVLRRKSLFRAEYFVQQ